MQKYKNLYKQKIKEAKEKRLEQCTDIKFRTLSLLPHASKILIKIVHRRIFHKAEHQYLRNVRNQYGFRK